MPIPIKITYPKSNPSDGKCEKCHFSLYTIFKIAASSGSDSHPLFQARECGQQPEEVLPGAGQPLHPVRGLRRGDRQVHARPPGSGAAAPHGHEGQLCDT